MHPAIERRTCVDIPAPSIAKADENGGFDGLTCDRATNVRALGRVSSQDDVQPGDRTRHDPHAGSPLDRPRLAAAPIGFHVTLRLEDDRPLATTAAGRRTLARVLLEQGEGRGLLAFGAADNHIHAELVGDRATARAFAQYVATSLRWRLSLAAPFERPRIRPLVDQRHAYNTFLYVQRQDARHALGADPTREATSLPDLLGLRVVDRTLASRARARLPRLRRDAVRALFPVDPFDVEIASGAPLAVLADAACAAFALPDLRGHGHATSIARHAAARAARPDAAAADVADVLGVGIRAAQRYRALPVDDGAVRAVVLQATLRSRLAASAT